jgi:hypothetical protein
MRRPVFLTDATRQQMPGVETPVDQRDVDRREAAADRLTPTASTESRSRSSDHLSGTDDAATAAAHPVPGLRRDVFPAPADQRVSRV